MFDISFFELLVCAIVALVVVGPERLPETVRTVSLWIGRLKRSLRETRSELEKQLGADDIRRQLYNEEIMNNLEKTRREIESAVQDVAGKEDSEKDTTKEQQSNKAAQVPAYVEHRELPDHAHMDEVPAATDDQTGVTPGATKSAPTTNNDNTQHSS